MTATPRRVSIALATYNGARFLAEQLEGYATQTVLPAELVVGDDGSTDGTLELLEAFAVRMPFPVRVTVNRPGLGAGANFIATALRCTGDVVLFSDQDDLWHPAKIETMLAVLAAQPDKWLALHDAALVTGSREPLGLTLAGQIEAVGEDPVEAHISGCCMALDARLAALFDVHPEVRLHDAWIGTLSRRLGLTCYTPAVLIDYRRHGSNVSQSWVAQEHRASRLDLLRQRLRVARAEPASTALALTVSESKAALLALDSHRAVLEQVVSASRINATRQAYALTAARASRRLHAHRSNGLQRVAALLHCACNGDYWGFSGLAALLRDLGLLGRT